MFGKPSSLPCTFSYLAVFHFHRFFLDNFFHRLCKLFISTELKINISLYKKGKFCKLLLLVLLSFK